MSPHSIKALIFDFDGLILNTETSGFQSWAGIYEEYGCHLPLSLYASRIGTNNNHFDPFKYLEEQCGRSLDRDRVMERWAQRSLETILTLPAMPGIEAFLTDAKQMGLKIGMASGSPHDWVDNHLLRLGLCSYFDCIKCTDDVAHSKPSPDLYQAVLGTLEISPAQTIAFEDSPHGVLAANRACVFCVAVPNFVTSQLTFEYADLILPSLADLTLRDLLSSVKQARRSV